MVKSAIDYRENISHNPLSIACFLFNILLQLHIVHVWYSGITGIIVN